jgi:hypothetical protein
MDKIAALLFCVICCSFTKPNFDLTFLYQKWELVRCKNDNGTPKLTLKPTKELCYNYGFQFGKDGTFSICRVITIVPFGMPDYFETVEGTWEMNSDSIIGVSYRSDGYSYHHTIELETVSAHELVFRLYE